MTETEIKIQWAGEAQRARELIEHRGYREIESRTLEDDQLFDRASSELRQSDQILRLRQTSSPAGAVLSAVITYKGPANRERYKSREEIEFEVSDASAFSVVLDRLGYRPTFRYQKLRTKFAISGEPGIVTIDETPVGIYLELEGPKDWIDGTAARLGFGPDRYLTASYASIYQEFRLQHRDAPADMIFSAGFERT